MIKRYIDFINEKRYYHGTCLHKDSDIDKFDIKKGYRSFFGVNYGVEAPWVFFADDPHIARKYGAAKTELYHDKGNFSYKTKVLEYEIDESKLNILDISNDQYEFTLQNIGLDPIEIYGMGMYRLNEMWELLDEKEYSDIIVNKGYNAVRLMEPDDTISLAIHISVVNDIVERV